MKSIPQGLAVDRIDAGRAVEASLLRFVRASASTDVIVSIDSSRSDQPIAGLETTPWITVALTRVAPANLVRPADRVVVADAAGARAARAVGWPASQVVVRSLQPTVAVRGRDVGILADVSAPAVPDSIERYSSQKLVWEGFIATIRSGRPIAQSPPELITLLAQAHGVDPADLPMSVMLTQLIESELALHTARQLVGVGVRPLLFGRGWDGHDDLRSFAIEGSFEDVLGRCSTLVDVWPARAIHPSRCSGRRMIDAWGRDQTMLVRELRASELVIPRTHAVAAPLDWARLQDLAGSCLKA
jgi:hypothetical protein